MLKSKAEVIAEVNFKPKAELGKENKTHPPGDISETLPNLCMGWLLYNIKPLWLAMGVKSI